MPALTTEPVRCRNREVVLVTGKFKPNGSSAIDNTANIGYGFSVAWSATGVYIITLDTTYSDLLDISLTKWGAVDAGFNLKVTAQDVASAKTITIAHTINAAGTFSAADIAAASTAFISFTAVLKNTGVTP